MMDRKMLESALFAAINESDCPVEVPAEVSKNLSSWSLRPIMKDHDIAAVVMSHGKEIHIAALPKYRKRFLTRSVICDHLYSILNNYGEVVTTVRQSHAPGHAFVSRFGFEPYGIRPDAVVLYKLTKEKYAIHRA